MLDLTTLPARTQRLVASWPSDDQKRFRRGKRSLPPRKAGRRSIIPRDSSICNYVDGYTRGHRWLQKKGWLDLEVPAEVRWSTERMQLFADESRNSGHKPNTVRDRVIGIWRVLSIMAPETDLRFLLLPLSGLPRRSTRDKSRLPTLSELAACGQKLMEKARLTIASKRSALEYRTGLQIAWLADLGLRLANLGGVEEGPDKNLCQDGDEWWVVFEGAQTKNHKYIEKQLSRDLVPYLIEYREIYRPILCRGRYGSKQAIAYAGDRLWASSRGEPQGPRSIYKQVAKATFREFRVRVTPHLFRDAIATAAGDAYQASLRLGNTVEVVERNYNHASTLRASRAATQMWDDWAKLGGRRY